MDIHHDTDKQKSSTAAIVPNKEEKAIQNGKKGDRDASREADGPGESLLKPLVSITSDDRSRKILKLFAMEEMEVDQVARFQYKGRLYASAHCLYVWMMEQWRQMMEMSISKEEKNLLLDEGLRVMQIVTDLEERLDGKNFLTSPMSSFLQACAATASRNDVGRTPEMKSGTKLKGDHGSSAPGIQDVDKWKSEALRLVKKPGADNVVLAKWDGIIGYNIVKEELFDEYVKPRQGKVTFSSLAKAKTCIILFGPPGTGKTQFVEGVASMLKFNFLSVTQADFASSYHGENLHKLRSIFSVATDNAPSILFFDEIEGILPNRQNVRNEHKKEEIDLFITEMNELKKHNATHVERQVLLFGATNLPDMMDDALWRRMEKHIHVPIPNDEDKRLMLTTFIGQHICSVLNDVDWKTVMLHTTGFSGQDIHNLSRFIEGIPKKLINKATHFRPLSSLKLVSERDDPNLSFTGFISHWTPCKSTHPDAKCRTELKLEEEDISAPPITACQIVEAARLCPGTLNIYDPKGSVKTCENFAEQFAQKLVDVGNIGSETDPFNSLSAYEEAKQNQVMRGSGSLEEKGFGMWNARCREIKPVIGWPFDSSEQARNKTERPLPAIPDEMPKEVQKVRKSNKGNVFNKLLRCKSFFEFN